MIELACLFIEDLPARLDSIHGAVAAFDQLSLEARRVIDVLRRFVSSSKQPVPSAS
jgi:hypothetical protein